MKRIASILILLLLAMPVFAQDTLSEWDGYDTHSVVTNAGAIVTDFTLIVSMNQFSADFWTAFDSGGSGAVRASMSDGTQIPCKVIHSTDSGTTGTGLLIVKWSGARATDNALTLRIYAGHASATEPAADATYGQENCFDANVRAFWPYGGGTDLTQYDNDLTMTGSPTVGGAAGPINGSLATDYDGSTQYGDSTISVPTVYPFTLLMHGRPENNTSVMTPLNIGSADVAQGLVAIKYLGNVASDPIAGRINAVQSTAIGYTLDTWSQAGARLINATSRFGYHDTTEGAENATNRTPASLSRLRVGAVGSDTPAEFFNGQIAFAEIHTVDRGAAWINYRKEMLDDPDQVDFYGTWSWTAAPSGPSAAAIRSAHRFLFGN